MVAQGSIPDLLNSLISSLDGAAKAVPTLDSLTPPADGISLLDAKNELFLSYLQNLVFLITLKLRNLSDGSNTESLVDDVTKKLVELRVYVEKGVRPLEGKLKYQLDKLLAAAADADVAKSAKHTPSVGKQLDVTDPDGEEPAPQISELSYRPNPAAFVRPSAPSRSSREEKEGVYRPPRITPTALPTSDRGADRKKRPRKSATVDDFIREELTDAPFAEPSIGAGSGLRGREREGDEERQAYEEQRLVRLPDEKKKRRRVGGGGEELDAGLGGLTNVDFGDLKARGKKKRIDGNTMGRRPGELWERRVKRGLKGKRK